MTGLTKYLLIACLAIMAIEGILIYHYRMQALTYQLQVAQITSGLDVAAEKQAVKADTINQTAIVTKLTQANADLQKQLENINAIQNAPKGDDAPTAPVLVNALNRLRVAPASH
jgi:hypothetical protein